MFHQIIQCCLAKSQSTVSGHADDKRLLRKQKNFKTENENAKWFVDAVSSRHSTIERIMSSIIAHQFSYFESDKGKFVTFDFENLLKILKWIFLQ